MVLLIYLWFGLWLLGWKLVDWRLAITVICGGCFCDVGCVDTQDAGLVACCCLVFVKRFLRVLMMFMGSVMVPYLCPVFNM
jgi:hypothetical protein